MANLALAQPRKRRAAVLGALLTCVLTVVLMPIRAGAAEPGVVPDLTWFPSTADQERTAAALEDSESKWVRLDVGWHDFEPSKGSYDPWSVSHYEAELQRARAAGQKVILMVHKSPRWASGSSDEQAPPRDAADYGRFMRFLAQRYGKYVDAWEVWNEPNYERFWPGGPDAGEYVKLLKAAYPAVKEVDPTAKVLFGGLSTNDWQFVDRAYAAGAKGYFDVMATHPFSCSNPPEKVDRDSSGRMTRGSFPAYREVRDTMTAHGDSKPIWFTEFGWSTTSKSCGVSESTQADYLRRAFEFVEKDPYVQVATWYNFRNNYWANDADETEARYGLMTTDFDRKPAYSAFKRYAAAGTQVSAATTTPVNRAPKVELTAPTSGDSYRRRLSLKANASDDRRVVKVKFRVGDRWVETDRSSPYGYVWRAPRSFSYGRHTVKARAYDADGATATDSVTVRRKR